MHSIGLNNMPLFDYSLKLYHILSVKCELTCFLLCFFVFALSSHSLFLLCAANPLRSTLSRQPSKRRSSFLDPATLRSIMDEEDVPKGKYALSEWAYTFQLFLSVDSSL